MKVLVVEDEASGRKLVEMMLIREHQVKAVESVDLALESLRTEAWDLIVTDYKMPGKTGLELVNLLQSGGSTIPIILMTGQSSRDEGVELIKPLVHKVLSKPFSRQDLISAVASVDNLSPSATI